MTKMTRRTALTLTAGGLFAAAAGAAAADAAPTTAKDTHPRVLVTPADRAAIQAKIKNAPWARDTFAGLKKDMDRYAALCARDPAYLTSRLLMNWETRYTQAVVEKEKFVRGEGLAPLPTPRFAGARDWATPYSLPTKIEDFRGGNDSPDKTGKIWLIHGETKKGEWVEPALTGRTIEVGNQRMMDLAADAGFVYWLTGDEKYARMGADLIWTFLSGFQHVQSPKVLDDRTKVIGMTSFEVIHEGILQNMGVAYDFLRTYMQGRGNEVAMMDTQLKRMCDRVIDGGNAEGNWNLNQVMNFIWPGLALADNSAYADNKGRQYYADIVLNARLPNQTGITHVIREGYDRETALWPEAPGYGFGTTPQMILFATLLGDEPAAKTLRDDPFLVRATLAQLEMLHPNGYCTGYGDTTNTRISAQALELLIATARKRGDDATEARLTTALQREIDGGYYTRGSQSPRLALTQYVTQLKSVSDAANTGSRTYLGKPLNVLFQRSPAADPNHALSVAMYGTKGGHVHANGLAIELYGAGQILGPDPGRGASYWTKDHGEYYRQAMAHNTVIINGNSRYAENQKPQHEMTVEKIEPAPGQAALSPYVSFATSGFHYESPVAAAQQRTLAVIRTGSTSGFYFDVFRSRAQVEANSFHDYLFHGIGQSLRTSLVGTGSASLASSELLTPTPANGLPKGYGYFKNERSAKLNDAGLHGVFTMTLPGEKHPVLSLWMPGDAPSTERTVFAVDAPQNRAIRTALPPEFSTMPMPTLLIRQTGEAWNRPFITVYEPSMGEDAATIHSVRPARVAGDASGLAACIVEGKDFSATLLQDDSAAKRHQIEKDVAFHGSFATILVRGNAPEELYLGSGKTLGVGDVSVTATEDSPINVSLRREGKEWSCSSDAPVRVGIVFSGVKSLTPKLQVSDGQGKLVTTSRSEIRSVPGASGQFTVTCELPAGRNLRLSLNAAAS